jgi:hypothetical protein
MMEHIDWQGFHTISSNSKNHSYILSVEITTTLVHLKSAVLSVEIMWRNKSRKDSISLMSVSMRLLLLACQASELHWCKWLSVISKAMECGVDYT